MAIVRVLVAVACALVLTAPSTTASPDDHRPATMTMTYQAGDLAAVVHAPRTLVGVHPLVLTHDVSATVLVRRGAVVVLAPDPSSLTRHRALWRELSSGTGPLAERFAGFAGHFSVAQP
ncbi:hypothetical protein SAMN04488074_104201 [Lentzea albidocapillata subsp. violacea]|uniref:Uncharacterized protein n=1 Tax=Lentzea albidocapillata subsp. violacea TaxID=128104 RepID=A0A1G8Z249_9PSEU|nr:hypothetical protein [Lentzea albidocapillata]SDK08320.1 hypothetical protein SAMN04488074_104201 [Lentzea albidocapillata subsp. violacea]